MGSKNWSLPRSIGRSITFLALCVVAAIQIYPLIWMILFSFKSNPEIFGGNILGLPQKWLWSNYRTALETAKIGVYFFNSVKVSFFSIILSIVTALMVSYAIARMDWKFKRKTLNYFLLGMMIPGQAILVPLYMLALRMGLINTHLILVLMYSVFALPTSIYIFVSFLEGIPREMEESAFMDGASVYRTFLQIIVPLIAPAVGTIVILNFLGVWNEFLFAFIFVDKESLRTIPVGLQSLNGRYFTNWGPIGAGMVVATMPTLLIYLIFSRQIQKGMVVGAVKG